MGGLLRYGDAVRAIKQAILKSQYEAAKGVNAQQLALYYSIGGYISANTRIMSGALALSMPSARSFRRNCRVYEDFRLETSST